MQFWNELEGQKIDGLYPLRRLVRSEGRSAWFETETVEPHSGAATISLTEALTDADEVTSRLQAAQKIKHPNLVNITKVGQARLDNTLLVYAVMEHIEQSLSDVLQGQALTAEEGREVAEALVGALTAIHQQGMSHGHVEAASVLATLETVKLRSDCLQMGTAGQAEDVTAIGTTLFHAFTQRKGLTATDAQINRIPAPFAEIIRNSFSRRWTLTQIANALKPVLPVSSPVPPVAPAPRSPVLPAERPPIPPAERPPVPPVTPPAKPLPPEAAATKAPERPPVSRPAPPTVPVAPPRPPLAYTRETGSPKRGPLALYIALAVAVLAILGWLIFRPRSASAPVNGNPPRAAIQPAPAAAPPAAKPAVGTPAMRAQTPSSGSPASVWHVIVYTYRFPKPAADKAAEISAKHADLDAQVFSPPGSKNVYLLTVGGAMNRSQAFKMLDKARNAGLPSDSYVKNYAQ